MFCFFLSPFVHGSTFLLNFRYRRMSVGFTFLSCSSTMCKLMFMDPTNAAVCQVISVTEKEAVAVSFKSTSVLNMTEKRPSLSLLILCLFLNFNII